MALPLYLGMLPVCSGHWPAWWSPLPGATPLFWAKVCASLASERRQGSPPVELVRYGSCKRKHVCVYHACMAKSLCRPPTKRTYGTRSLLCASRSHTQGTKRLLVKGTELCTVLAP
jgi:hypothetical protein